MGLKKSYRIKKNEDFQEILRHGESFANRQLVMYYRRRLDDAPVRVGLSVGKKIGNAVVRNQIKRYLRQAFFERLDLIKPGYDLIVIARKPTADLDFHALKKSLDHLLYKTSLFQKNVSN